MFGAWFTHEGERLASITFPYGQSRTMKMIDHKVRVACGLIDEDSEVGTQRKRKISV